MKNARKIRKGTKTNSTPVRAKSPTKVTSLEGARRNLKLATPQDFRLEAFLKAANHELSNMLGTILGELDYALSNPNPAVKTRAITTALSATERARSLARNLSYFALNSATKPAQYSLSQLVHDTLELSQNEFLHRRIRTQSEIDANLSAMGDASAMQQALLNIFRRALSTMPQGGNLSVQLSQKGGLLELTCRDNGVGIPAQRLEHLLAPDFSEQPTISDPNELELFVTRALCEKQGAKFEVQSSVGIGTTYTIRITTEESRRGADFIELRRFRRIQASLPVEISFNGTAPFRSEMQTLSVGGCYIQVTDPQAALPPKESVGNLRIYYYQDQILDVHRCRIASISTQDGKAGMGLEFLEIDPKAEKLLRAIVHSHGFNPES